jgi:hypothetical protein
LSFIDNRYSGEKSAKKVVDRRSGEDVVIHQDAQEPRNTEQDHVHRDEVGDRNLSWVNQVAALFFPPGSHHFFRKKDNGIQGESNGIDDIRAPGDQAEHQVMEYHAAGNKNDKDQVGAFPVAAQEGIKQEEKISCERVPHPPEPAEAPFREAFPDHTEHHLTRGHIIISPAAKVLSECYGRSSCQHDAGMRKSNVMKFQIVKSKL